LQPQSPTEGIKEGRREEECFVNKCEAKCLVISKRKFLDVTMPFQYSFKKLALDACQFFYFTSWEEGDDIGDNPVQWKVTFRRYSSKIPMSGVVTVWD
jgi:hypothetical protein